MVAGWFRFAIMIANHRGDEIAIAAFETRDITVQGEVFTVFVVTAMADHVTDVVKQCASFEQYARWRRQVVNRL